MQCTKRCIIVLHGLSMKRNECYNCAERHPNCWSTCEKYKSFKKELERIRVIKQKEQAISQAISEILGREF